MAKAGTLPSSCYNNANMPVEVVNLRTAEEILENGDQRIETEEVIAVRVESSSDIKEKMRPKMKKLSQILMKIKISTMIEPKWQRRHFFSLAPDQDLEEQLGLMESFLTEKGAGLFHIQVVHLWYCSWENIAIKFIFQKIYVLQSFQDSCLYFSRYNILVRQ